MANFQGHALPGSLFIIFGLWWSVKYSMKYHSRRWKKNGHGNRQFNLLEIIEGSAKIACAVIGMLAEQFVPSGPHLQLYGGNPRTWVKLMNWQHTTMYLFFGISGVADVLTYSSSIVPRGLDRLMLSIALFIEGFLFYFHIVGRPMLDQHVHTLLLITTFAGAASLLVEVFLQENIILELFCASLSLLQGTWFYQVGFVLFPPWGGPGWDENDHSNVMFITMCFCWHYVLAICIVAGNYVLVYHFTQKRWASSREAEIKLGFRKQRQEKDSRAALLKESDEE
ncbi:transmembrane protein 45B-like [Paroedura picta]|uniref:transmembrane protein 45B-like n=1 Tax=Paroedura picta TaxID=143630 RepID=UPI00405659FB